MGPCRPEGGQRKELMGSLRVKRLGGLRHRTGIRAHLAEQPRGRKGWQGHPPRGAGCPGL